MHCDKHDFDLGNLTLRTRAHQIPVRTGIEMSRMMSMVQCGIASSRARRPRPYRPAHIDHPRDGNLQNQGMIVRQQHARQRRHRHPD